MDILISIARALLYIVLAAIFGIGLALIELRLKKRSEKKGDWDDTNLGG